MPYCPQDGHMDLFNIVALLVTLAAVLSYLNHRYLRLPTTIGLMVIALAMSLAFIATIHQCQPAGPGPPEVPGIQSGA